MHSLKNPFRGFPFSFLRALRFILGHPLNRGRRGAAMVRYLRWQVGARLLPGAALVPFVNETKLLATPGMTGVTGNIYCGLAEFDDMAFVLHMLRADDLFVDVGANVGAYALLAGGCPGKCFGVRAHSGNFCLA